MALTAQEAQHFLRRVGFGGRADEIAHFVGRERGDVVAEVLDRLPTAPPKPDFLGYEGKEAQWLQMLDGVEWWIQRMIDSRWTNLSADTPSPLQEKMALMWHGHFCCEQDKVYDMQEMWFQNQLFRVGGLGDFEQLTKDVSVGPAMLVYLDNNVNYAGAEQENFARELMELFTIGVGNFTEDDVVSMAKAWTGHSTVGWNRELQRHVNDYVIRWDRHDNTQKTLFGKTRNWNGPGTITELVNGVKQQQCAEFIATKAWRFFAGLEPTPAIKSQLAGAFIAGGMNIKELMRAVLMHPTFWSNEARWTIIKSPTEFVVTYLRQIPVPWNTNINWSMRHMGQTLFNPPNVGGWGRNQYWLSAATMWGRARWVSGNRWQLSQQGYLDELETMNASEGVQRLFNEFGITQPTAASRASLESWFNNAQNGYRWSLMESGVLTTALSPEFQVV